MLKNFYKKTNGFTLAEVLLTLVIIGIISAVTIPALINSTNNKEYKTAWKKIYSEISAIHKMVVYNEDGSLKGVFTNSGVMANKFLSYLNYNKVCYSNANGDCWHTQVLNQTGGTEIWANTASVILNDQMLLRFSSSLNCNAMTGVFNRCGQIQIDVNGFKLPNTIGKDIFAVSVLEDRIIPYGTPGDSYNTDSSHVCNTTGTGWQCSAEYLLE